MSRPCHCRRAAPGPERPGDCHLCWLALNAPKYARLWGEPAPADPQAPPNDPPPCRHLGDPVPGPERERLSLGHAREWRYCATGHGKGGAVCGCKAFPAGCAGCPDYSADTGE